MTTESSPNDPEYRSMMEGQDNFVGWHISGPTTGAITCAGASVVHTSGTYARCCSFDVCYMATACRTAVLTWQNGDTSSCGDGFSCVTMEMFSTFRTEEDARVRIFCGRNWGAHTVYGHIPEPTTTEPTVSSTAASGSTPTEPGASSTARSSASSTASPGASSAASADEGDDGDGGGGGGSMAWIAGAVIGPIFLIAVIVLAFWWYRRRRAAKGAAGSSQDPSTHHLSQAYSHDPRMSQIPYHDGPGQQHDPRVSQMYQQQHGGYVPPPSTSPRFPGAAGSNVPEGYYAPQSQPKDDYHAAAPMELDAGRRETPAP